MKILLQIREKIKLGEKHLNHITGYSYYLIWHLNSSRSKSVTIKMCQNNIMNNTCGLIVYMLKYVNQESPRTGFSIATKLVLKHTTLAFSDIRGKYFVKTIKMKKRRLLQKHIPKKFSFFKEKSNVSQRNTLEFYNNKQNNKEKNINNGLSTDENLEQIHDYGNPECFCLCCKDNTFSQSEFNLYELAKGKGRRGNVLSLDIDQSTSYVTILGKRDIFFTFRFLDFVKSR